MVQNNQTLTADCSQRSLKKKLLKLNQCRNKSQRSNRCSSQNMKGKSFLNLYDNINQKVNNISNFYFLRSFPADQLQGILQNVSLIETPIKSIEVFCKGSIDAYCLSLSFVCLHHLRGLSIELFNSHMRMALPVYTFSKYQSSLFRLPIWLKLKRYVVSATHNLLFYLNLLFS